MLEKPSDADARALKTLFPSSSHLSKRSHTAGFSPLECVYSKEKIEDEARIKFMQSAGCVANLSTHKVNRITLYNDLLALYMNCNDLIQEYHLSMEFIGEQAVDLGGVSRDVMSAFWQTTYEKLFDGSKLFVPVVSPHVELSLLPALGKILSHGYLCTGFLPTQIAFPSLAGPNVFHGLRNADCGLADCKPRPLLSIIYN